jgi:hypothetical protein
MKVVENLSGTVVEKAFEEKRGAPHAVCYEVPWCKGWLINLFLGPEGVKIRRGSEEVVIPTAEMLRVASGGVAGLLPTADQVSAVKDAEEKARKLTA